MLKTENNFFLILRLSSEHDEFELQRWLDFQTGDVTYFWRKTSFQTCMSDRFAGKSPNAGKILIFPLYNPQRAGERLIQNPKAPADGRIISRKNGIINFYHSTLILP